MIEEVHAALDGGEAFEVIYVNDGSIDETAQRLVEAASRFPLLRVLTHGQSCGQSAAIRTGVDAALGAWIVTLDGDGQNDPADIPALVRVALGSPAKGPDMVAGIRVKRQDSWFRRLMSRIANAVRQGLLRDQVSDTGCGLKVIRRSLFLQLPYFDHMHRYLPALVLRAGGRVETVAVGHRPRLTGRSNYGLNDRLWVGIVDLLGVMWLRARHNIPAGESTDRPDDA